MASNQIGGVARTTAIERARRGAIKSADVRRGKKRTPNPLTGEVIYEGFEVAYLKSVDAYRIKTGKKFLTAIDHLRIAMAEGIVRLA